jgi:hypothetical protein
MDQTLRVQMAAKRFMTRTIGKLMRPPHCTLF